MHKDFSEVLTEFMEITDIKMKELALYLEYDISYINKWVNGKNIPSQKIAEKILVSLAVLFAQKIYEMNREEELKKITERKVNPVSFEAIGAIVRSILIDGFYASSFAMELEQGEIKENYTETLIDQEEIVKRAFLEIEKAISLAQDEINIYITLDLYQLFRKIFAEDEIFYVTRGVNVNIYWIMEKGAIIFNEGLENELYYLMGKCSYFNTYVYLTDEILTRPYILIENELIMNFIINQKKDIMFMNITNEKHLLKEFKEIAAEQFEDDKLILAATEEETTEFDVIMDSLQMKDNRFILHGVFPDGFFFTEEVLIEVMHRHKIKANQRKNLLRLRRALETMVKEYPIILLISKKALIHFMPKYQITLGAHSFTLTKEEMRICEENRNNIIKNNANIKFGIIDDEVYPYKIFDQGLTVNCSKNHVWFKKNPLFLDEYVKPYYTVIQQDIVDIIGNFTEGLNYDNNFFNWLDYESYCILIDGIMESSNDIESW